MVSFLALEDAPLTLVPTVRSTTLLRAALPLSMALHRSVTAQGTYILDKQDVKSFRNYRLAIVKEGPRLDVFRHPATLLRLALWLVDSVRDLIGQGGTDRVWSKSLPFVLASMDQESDSFFVVGVVGAAQFGDVKKKCVSSSIPFFPPAPHFFFATPTC